MGTSDWDLFRKVIFPSAIPSIVAGMRLGVKASLFSVIAAEMLAARSGIGFLIQNAQLMLKAADMYAGILVLTAVGLLLNYAARLDRAPRDPLAAERRRPAALTRPAPRLPFRSRRPCAAALPGAPSGRSSHHAGASP